MFLTFERKGSSPTCTEEYAGYPQKSVIHNFNSTRPPIKYAA